jgi:hypothetical protein
MTKPIGCLLFCVSVFILSELCRCGKIAAADDLPRTFVLKRNDLLEVRKRLQSLDASLLPAFNKLKRDADAALPGEAYSVTNKTFVPPSGDKHDYMSIAPYWWPNSNSPDGLPYVRRDGEINPERGKVSDRSLLSSLIENVKTLALAYCFTGRENYAAQATKLLRVWFLEEATKMNPNLRYAQAIPGRNEGRGAGIIETHDLPELVDAVGLLGGSTSWRQDDQRALERWFDAYLTWLLQSPQGLAESQAQNNHGSWYDVQIASFSFFVNKKDVAKKILGEFPTKRIDKQIEPDGRQPRELERTQAWSYSLFNLEALFNAASLGDYLGIDLWNYEARNKRTIRKALDWLLPYAIGGKKWSYKEIAVWQPERLAPLLRRAALRYREASYLEAIDKLSGVSANHRSRLLYPVGGIVIEQPAEQ